MYNSIKVFIFSLITASIAFYFSYNTLLFNNLIKRTSNSLQAYNIDIELLNIQWAEEDKIDISSKLNINFVDFTMFKKPQLANLLLSGYSWVDLDNFRLEKGFVMNIDLYAHFFKEEVSLDEIFTLYNTPNINNCSDTMVEVLYTEVTGKEFEATQLKSYIQQRRRLKEQITQSELNQLKSRFDKDVIEIFTTEPTWNKENVHPLLLQVVMSYSEEVEKTWIGEVTTHYKIEINSEDHISAELIYRLNGETNEYDLFSFYRGLQ